MLSTISGASPKKVNSSGNCGNPIIDIVSDLSVVDDAQSQIISNPNITNCREDSVPPSAPELSHE